MEMPSSVKWARGLLWAEMALGVIALCALTLLMGQAGEQVPQNLVWVSVLLVLVWSILVGVLAARMSTRRNWVRITTIVVQAVSIASSVFNAFNGQPSGLCGVIIPVIILILLNQQDAKDYFDR